MEYVTVNCGTCGARVTVKFGQFVYRRKKNRTQKFYCNRVCAANSATNIAHLKGLVEIYGTPVGCPVPGANRRYKTVETKAMAEMLRRARGRRHECSVTLTNLAAIFVRQNKRCALTNIPLDFTAPRLFYPSLDRINSSEGYILGNVQLVVTAANLAKGNASDKEFSELVLAIISNNTDKT